MSQQPVPINGLTSPLDPWITLNELTAAVSIEPQLEEPSQYS